MPANGAVKSFLSSGSLSGICLKGACKGCTVKLLIYGIVANLRCAIFVNPAPRFKSNARLKALLQQVKILHCSFEDAAGNDA